MGLLDSDAEELKKSAEGSPSSSSGRKVNQSGLGAFRGISKYSKLTEKYRAKSPTPEISASTVEHRGTNSTDSLPSPTLVPDSNIEVGAKTVQSHGNASASHDDTLSVQSGFQVGAKNWNDTSDKKIAHEPTSAATTSQFDVSADDAGLGSIFTEISREEYSIFSTDIVLGEPDLGAKSVQSTNPPSAIADNSQGKVSSNIMTILDEFDRDFSGNIKASALPVQTPGEIDSSSGGIQPEEASAKSVRGLLTSKDATLSNETPNGPFPGRNAQVSANSVQTQAIPSAECRPFPVPSPGELSAYPVQGQARVRSIVSAPLGAKLVQKQGSLEPLESITSLAGAQRITIQFLFNRCLWNNSLISPPITKQQLIEGTQLKEETVLSAVKRLRTKNILDRYAYKDGKSGWTQYRISEDSYRELLQLNQYNGVQSPGKVSSEVSSEVSARHSSSSSSFHNKNTTSQKTTELPEDWQNIDFSSLVEYRFGRAHLQSLYQDGKLRAEEVQRCIHELDYDLRVNKRIFRTGPLNAFMGILRKGQPYVAAGYESQEDIELKANLERLKSREKERQAIQQELRDIAFRDWKDTLSAEMKKAISPFFPEASPGFDAALKGHFEEKIWKSKTS